MRRAANNYTTLQEFTADSNKAGGKVDVQVSPTLSVFGRYGFRNLSTFDQPNIPLPGGRGGQRRRSTRGTGSSSSARRGSRRRRRCSKCGSATRGRRRVRPRRRSARRARSSSSVCPACRTIRGSRGACRRQLINGFSDLGRQQTNPQWQYPVVFNPKVNYTWMAGNHSLQERLRITVDRHGSAGRQSALRARHLQRQLLAAGGNARRQPVQPGRLHARAAGAVCAQQRARRQPAAQHALCVSPGRLAHLEPADAQSRTPLRVLDAVLGREQHPLELRSGQSDDDYREGRVALRSRARRSGPQQLRPTPRASPIR